MENLDILFFLLFSAVLLVGIAQKVNVPYPIILILGGTTLSFIPGLDNISFNPNLVLTVFLPPILYYAAFAISFREFQRGWRNIFSLALGLVLITTLVIAILFKWLFPQFSWPLAFAFGAIVSPPDAVAVTSILKRFSMNSRLITLLEGESLINDASAIVIYKLSIVALMTGTLSYKEAGLDFTYVVLGGVLIGLVLGWLAQEFSRRFLEPVLGVVFSFTIPFATYILADTLGVSGVLAVVVNGLIGARLLHAHHAPLRRILGYAFWDIFIILLNCLVFILIGLQVRTIGGTMTTHQIILYTGYALLIAFTMVVVRLIWVYARASFVYLQHPKAHNQIFQESAIIGWAGMRGIVSLAVALSLPYTLPNGEALAGRNEVIFMTFAVIFITLLIPGLTLPALIQKLELYHPHKDHVEKRIRHKLAKIAEEKLEILFQSNSINEEECKFLKNYFSSQHTALAMAHESEKNLSNIENARRKIMHYQRTKLIEIWKNHEIDDKLFTHLENELDMLEIHTARAELKVSVQ
jgi:CPA1 family monovalent cation:H+ antiporter